MNRLAYFGIGLLFLLVVIVVGALFKKRLQFFKEEDQFIKTEVRGVILKLRDQTHGEYELSVRQYNTQKTLQFSLAISQFIRENNISINDSISKAANSNVIYFYSNKTKGEYQKISELSYYY